MPGFKHISKSCWPENVGILAIEVYFPSYYVCQKELEEFDEVSEGKYTIGLGQSKMGFCSDAEDINSLCLTALTKLMENTKVGYSKIGRLEVGTETIIDKSKSVKSVLMQVFEESGNCDIEGVDCTNACYGGTAALFNALNWVESSSWDGRFAVVVTGDIAVYAQGNARPTGGAGAVAMLVGPNAPLVIERGLRASCMKHVYDFYKPDLSSEYPFVDGKLSIECYFAALDSCYQNYLRKAEETNYGSDFPTGMKDFDVFAFHSPYCKLVQKSFARLVLNDYFRCPSSTVSQLYPGLERFRDRNLSQTYFDKDVEKAFMTFSKDMFDLKTKASLLLATQVGNMYTASLYGGLASILSSFSGNPESLIGKRIGMFSYGSGFTATMFSIKVSDNCEHNSSLRSMLGSTADIPQRLDLREKISPSTFTHTMSIRESALREAPYTPKANISSLLPGTWYLSQVDDLRRRHYLSIPHNSPSKLPVSSSPMKDQFGLSSPNCSSDTNGHSNGNGNCVKLPRGEINFPL